MIKESLKIHGSRQFEVKQKVSFPKDVKEIQYQVETFFFLPGALQINEHTYSGADFQKTLKGYVRLRSPTERLENFTKAGGAVEKLTATISESPSIYSVQAEARYESALKIFALTFKRALRKACNNCLENKNLKLEDLDHLAAEARAALFAYRKLWTVAEPVETRLGSKTFGYCDEFMSVMTGYYLKKLFYRLPVEMRHPITELWIEEVDYRQKMYPCPVPEGETPRSAFLLRWSVLKKYVSNYLFLDVRYRKGNPVLIHSIYGFAAALSMFFAMLIAFSWQEKYGSLSMNLFFAMIIGYIFKDRLKEVSRDWLAKLFSRWIPDRRLLIYREPDIEVGVCKESFHFVDSSKLPASINELRHGAHWVSLVHDRRTESVLCYRKEVTLRNQHQLFHQTQYALMDITRFNISDFLRNIDSKFEELPIFDEEDENSVGEKLYHIYMLRRVTFEGYQANELVRLVVNVEGIKRLEVIKPLQAINVVETENDLI